MYPEGLILSLTLAVALDLLLGDPVWLPHPVRWMGRAIERMEPRFRSLPLRQSVSGALMAAILVAVAWLAGMLMVWLSISVNLVAAVSVQALMIFYCISVRSLATAALAVGKAVDQSGLEAGRQAVSRCAT